MVATIDIKEHMEVIGADGAFVGKVDKVEGERIKLTKDDGHGGKRDHHHFLPVALVADIDGGKVRLSATAANALGFQEEESGKVVTGEPTNSAKDSAFAFGKDGDAATQADASAQSGSKGLKVGAAALGAAAAVGAAAFGAAKLIKARSAGGTGLQLADDETMRLISSAKVEGTKVFDLNGAAIGSVQSFMVDKYSGQVAYAILSFGGAFGFGASLFPLPWAALDYDDEIGGYRLGVTKEQLADAPKFAPSDAPEFDTDYRQRVILFYRAA